MTDHARTTTPIPAGADLQKALQAAAPGDVLELERGATWVGNFTLPPPTGAAPITVRTAGDPPAGVPLTGDGLATLRTTTATPALRTIGNAAGWRFGGLQFACGASSDDIVRLGDGLISDAAQLPRDLEFDRCLFHADQTAKNGIQLNAAAVTLRACAVRGVKLAGIESHAVITYNSPGPFLIEDCHLEAGSCGFFVGGAKPAIANLVPSDLTFRRNLTTRPLALHGQTGWGIKNLFELKNARRVVATGNTFEHNWPDGQAGFAIVFTVRANSATAPWTTIEDVLFQDNLIRHVAMGFNVLGLDNQTSGGGPPYPSQRMTNVVVRNNLVYDLDRTRWASPTGSLGSGVFLQIDGAPHGLVVERNTAMGVVTGNIASLSGDPMPGFVCRANIVQKTTTPYQTYGVFGNAVGEGNPALARYTGPDRVFTGNVLAGCTPAHYSDHPGNTFPTIAALHADFVDEAAGNYRLIPTSDHIGAGVDQDAMEAAQVPPSAPEGPGDVHDTIRQLADASRAAMATVGGDVSPQAAAVQAIDHYEAAMLAAVPA